MFSLLFHPWSRRGPSELTPEHPHPGGLSPFTAFPERREREGAERRQRQWTRPDPGLRTGTWVSFPWGVDLDRSSLYLPGAPRGTTSLFISGHRVGPVHKSKVLAPFRSMKGSFLQDLAPKSRNLLIFRLHLFSYLKDKGPTFPEGLLVFGFTFSTFFSIRTTNEEVSGHLQSPRPSSSLSRPLLIILLIYYHL